MSELPNAPATLRNRDAILQILRAELDDDARVLEIGSGTGQHAVYFADHLRSVSWQPSDVAANLAGIEGWVRESGLSNVAMPLQLNVADACQLDENYDAVYSANTAHIMSEQNVRQMMAIVAGLLNGAGRLLLYGPFRIDGAFTSESNARFDESLRQQNPKMGIRDIEWIDELARRHNLEPGPRYAMPANNLLLTWSRRGEKAE